MLTRVAREPAIFYHWQILCKSSTKHTIGVSYEYWLKHPRLDPGVIFSSYTFQGTNNVMNYEVDQRYVSVQDVLETQEPLITLSQPAQRWNKAE